MAEKQRRFHSPKHGGTVTFSLGKRFALKIKAKAYAQGMRKKGFNARIIKVEKGYAVYTRRER